MDINNNYDQISCIVENGYNTCYIDSLLTALFYKDTNYTNYILEHIPKKPEGYYLQELIRSKFINALQRNYSITSNIINEIRNYSVICGWSSDGDITDQKDCGKYFTFLMDLFNIKSLEFEIFEIKNNIMTDNIEKISSPFISFNITKDDTIKNLLQYWINSKIYSPDENIIYCYKLSDIPQFIILHINRFNTNGIRIQNKIDITKRLKFFGINDQSQKYLRWKIHGIICHRGNSMYTGHYYSILTTYDRKWLLFDDMLIPSFEQIDLSDEDIKEKIMSEVTFVIYTLDL